MFEHVRIKNVIEQYFYNRLHLQELDTPVFHELVLCVDPEVYMAVRT